MFNGHLEYIKTARVHSRKLLPQRVPFPSTAMSIAFNVIITGWMIVVAQTDCPCRS